MITIWFDKPAATVQLESIEDAARLVALLGGEAPKLSVPENLLPRGPSRHLGVASPPRLHPADAPTGPEGGEAPAPPPVVALPKPKKRADGKIGGTKAIILAAFSANQDYPLPELAKHIHGSSNADAMRKLKIALRNYVAAGLLKRRGAASYVVVKS